MPKFSREELSSRINDLDIEEQIKMALIEDITDSIVDESEELANVKAELDASKNEYNDLYEKYKARFMGKQSEEPPKVDEKEDIEEDEEEKVIDIKEII